MVGRHLIWTGSVFAGLLAFTGCEIAYNGAWLMSPEDRAAMRAKRQTVVERMTHQQPPKFEPPPLNLSPRRSSSRAQPMRAPAAGIWPPDTTVSTASHTPAVQRNSDRAMASTETRPDTQPIQDTMVNNSGSGQPVTRTIFTTVVPKQESIRQTSSTSTKSTGGPSLYGDLTAIDPQALGSDDRLDNLRQVTFTLDGSDFDPVLAPSGDRLIFASTQHSSTADLYIKDVSGSAVTQLTSDPANDVMPTMSPDGQWLAFASDRSGNWDIYLIHSNGGPTVQLTNDPSHDVHPSFSPDGNQLVYSSYSERSQQWELVVVDPNSPAARRYIGPGLFPVWSPVSNHIAYQRAQQRGTNWFSIWVIEVIEGEGVRPTQVALTPDSASVTPCWSPDGQRLAFSSIADPDAGQDDHPPKANLWVVNADGSSRAMLTRSKYSDLQPVWSSDGTIYFRSNRAKNNAENIWSIQPNGAGQIDMIDIKQAKTVFVPSPDELNE